MHTTSSVPRIAWAADPHLPGNARMAHAIYAGQVKALCGAATPYVGELWPRAGEPWPSSHSRCPSCAHHVYASRRP